MEGKTPAKSALTEAWEEGGVNGKTAGDCVGVYSYAKLATDEDDLSCMAMLYPIEVKSLSKQYPERGMRKRKWVSRKEASRMVAEPELARLLRDFKPLNARTRDSAP